MARTWKIEKARVVHGAEIKNIDTRTGKVLGVKRAAKPHKNVKLAIPKNPCLSDNYHKYWDQGGTRYGSKKRKGKAAIKVINRRVERARNNRIVE